MFEGSSERDRDREDPVAARTCYAPGRVRPPSPRQLAVRGSSWAYLGIAWLLGSSSRPASVRLIVSSQVGSRSRQPPRSWKPAAHHPEQLQGLPAGPVEHSTRLAAGWTSSQLLNRPSTSGCGGTPAIVHTPAGSDSGTDVTEAFGATTPFPCRQEGHPKLTPASPTNASNSSECSPS
jgi:hypothetical protein